ncbi:MAG TPA: glycosyltransferase [Thermoplasmata archaeon]|nr:glycosyltransferase [Thermoplasmata archaeon]
MLAACLGIPVVFMESLARVSGPSLTGRIIRHWCDLTIVPWPSLRAAYPHAIVVTPPMRGDGARSRPPTNPSIIVLTGTSERGFNRLLRELDCLIEQDKLSPRVFAQIGDSTYRPRNYRSERYIPHDQLLQQIRNCDLVITHDGAGSIGDALRAGKPTIVVPRRSDIGELIYHSDLELANHLASLGWIFVADNPADIPSAVDRAGLNRPSALNLAGAEESQVIAEFLDRLTSQKNQNAPPA